QHVRGREFFIGVQHVVNALSTIRREPLRCQQVRIVFGGDAGVCGGNDSVRRIVHGRQLVKRHIAGPVVLAVGAGDGNCAVAGSPRGNKAHGLVADVAVDIAVDDILRRSGKDGERLAELLPVLRGVKLKQRDADLARVIEHPLERDLPRLNGEEGADYWSVARDDNVKAYGGLAFYVDGLMLPLWRLPAAGSFVLALLVEVFYEQVLHVRVEVGKSPGNALVVSHDDIRHAG